MPLFGLKPVTGAAFSLARYKIKLSFFNSLNAILIRFHQQAPQKLWRGYQLIAGDGSTVGLPPSKQIKDYFGIYAEKGNGVKSCMAQVFMFYDVLTNFVVSSRISVMADSEIKLSFDCLGDIIGHKSIIIMDRGFGYFNVLKRLLDHKKDFCIRISKGNSLFAKQVMGNPENDFITQWNPSVTEKATCAKYGHNENGIRVRVTKIKLKTGEIEILASSLYDMNEICTQNIKELYFLRWGVEEGFKKLKPKMRLEQFGSRKPNGIFQEFQAHLFMFNIIAVLGMEAQEEIDKTCKTRKLKYKYNWQNAFRYTRREMTKLINQKDVSDILKLLIELISDSKIPIKPDREFKRITFKKRKNRLHQTYK